MDDLMQALEAYVDARCRVATLEAKHGPRGSELQVAIQESDELRTELRDLFLSTFSTDKLAFTL